MFPPPGPARRPGIAAPARPAEGDAAVAYDVQPTVVVVLVGALALLALVAIVAVLTLAPSARSLAEAPLVPATSVVRNGPGETGEAATEPAEPAATGPAPSSSTAAPSPKPEAGAVPPARDTAPAGGGMQAPTPPTDPPAAARPPPGGPPAGSRAPADVNAAAGDGSTGSPPPQILIARPPDTPTGPVPVVPVNLDAVPGQSTALLWWAVIGPTVELGGFRVRWSGGGRSIDQQVGPDARTSQVAGLLPGTGYAVAITPLARDGQPVADAAQTIGVTTLPRSLPPPAAPANLTLAAGPGSLTVSWTADPADLATTQFQISWACCGAVLGSLSVDREVRSHTINGLASGVVHTVEVQALGPELNADQSTRRTVSGTPS